MLRLPAAAVALGLDPECRNDAGGPADIGGGGAGAPLDAPVLEPNGSDAQPSSAAGDVVDDDDDGAADDAEIDNSPLRNDPRVTRLRNRVRSLNRRVAKHRDLVETARALNVTPQQLRESIDFANRYREALPVLQSQEFLEVALRRRNGGASAQQQERRQPPPPAFDDSDFPFDRNDPAGRWMYEREKRHHAEKTELVEMVRSLSNDLAQLRGGFAGQQRAQEVGTWRTTMEAAASKVPEKINGIPLRTLFKDAVVGAFHMAKQRGVRLDPQRVIAHYLKEFNLPSSTQTAARAAASQQRMAEQNQRRPGASAFVGGSPSNANPDRSKERVSDVSRRLVGRHYVHVG